MFIQTVFHHDLQILANRVLTYFSKEKRHKHDVTEQQRGYYYGNYSDHGFLICLHKISFTGSTKRRYYLAPLFWFVVGGAWGPLTLIAYSVLRAWQTWLARYQTPHHRLQSGIDGLLHIVDWLPVRLVGVVYALVGHGEKALPAWFASLGDRHSSQYQVLTRLAQYSLAREPHVDKVATPKAAVSMAKKTSLVVVVIMALLTIYGTLV